MPKIKIIRALDEFLLNQVQDFKESSAYQTLSDNYNQFEEWQQALARAAMMVISIGVPLLFLSIFYLIYSMKANELEVSEKIIHSASRIIGESSQLRTQSNKLFGAEINTESQLSSRLNSALSMDGIDGTKLKVANFFTDEKSGITETSAQIQFRDFSSNNIYSFLKRLFILGSYKVKEIHIEKNKNNKLLEGRIDISLFSRVSAANE